MFSLYRQRTPNCSALRRACRSAGFTLSEIVIALAVLGTMASGVYIGFNAINAHAVGSRLYSEAQTAAQNQIDLVLSKEPFDVSVAYASGSFDPCVNKIPPELMTPAELDIVASATTCADGTTRTPVTFPTAAPTSTPAITSPYYPYYPYFRDTTITGSPLAKNAFIYRDPVTGQVLVTGELISIISDTATTMTFVGTTSNLYTRKASVSVKYSFRRVTDGSVNPATALHGDYTVSMETLRTADQ